MLNIPFIQLVLLGWSWFQMKKVVNQAVGTLTAVADTSYFTISSFPITEEGTKKKRNVELKRNEPVNEIGDELT